MSFCIDLFTYVINIFPISVVFKVIILMLVWYSVMWKCHNLLTYSPIVGHLGTFLIINSGRCFMWGSPRGTWDNEIDNVTDSIFTQYRKEFHVNVAHNRFPSEVKVGSKNVNQWSKFTNGSAIAGLIYGGCMFLSALPCLTLNLSHNWSWVNACWCKHTPILIIPSLYLPSLWRKICLKTILFLSFKDRVMWW